MEAKGWGVLFAFSITTAFNAFLFMNFATISTVSKEAFQIGTQELNWLYSAALVTVVPLFFPAAFALDHYNYAASFIGALATFLTAWVRYLAILRGSYPLAVFSSVLLGVSSAVVISTPTQLAQSWFPQSRRTLVTSIAVQSNYFGWCLGGAVTPHIIASVEDLRTFLLWQAVASCSVLVSFVALHRAPTKLVFAGDLSPTAPLLTNKSFLIHGIAFALLAAVSFTIPAVQDEVFHTIGFSADANSLTNLAFLLSGVLIGFASGAFVPPHRHVIFLKFMFILSSLCLTGLSLTVRLEAHLSHDLLRGLNLVFMALAGAGSLGFIGIGLSYSALLGKPVSDTYSGGGVEWAVQIFSVAITQSSTEAVGFDVCTGVAWFATILLFVGSFCCAMPNRPELEGLVT